MAAASVDNVAGDTLKLVCSEEDQAAAAQGRRRNCLDDVYITSKPGRAGCPICQEGWVASPPSAELDVRRAAVAVAAG